MAGVTFSTFAGQNWLIAPVALALNEPRPSSIVEQRWHIEFSGVGILDLTGNNPNDWRRETLVFFPDVDAPLKFAIARYSIPVPTSSFGTVSPSIVVDQIVPYVAVSSAFEKSSGGADFGFAIDAWRPNPFFRANDVNNVPQSNIFTGIDADVAVRNTNATIHRVSYHITIIGKIVFLVRQI
jgi:hypothetical protein